MAVALKEELRKTLDNLSVDNFKRFKHHLKDQGPIPWGKLEKADTDDTVDLMVQVYTMEAGVVMVTILKKMNHNQFATNLERVLGESLTGEGGGVNIDAAACSVNTVHTPASSGGGLSAPQIGRGSAQKTATANELGRKREEAYRNLKLHLQSILRKRCLLVRQDLGDERLQDIYTELCIMEGRSGGVDSAHEVSALHLKHAGKRTHTGYKNSVKLSNLFSDQNHVGEPVTKVLTLGIAGVGKTVAVQKFVLDWAEERNNINIELVFVLPFRELNLYKDKEFSLFDLLLKFYPNLEELREFTELKKSKALFVFDGLDESRFELDFKNYICDPKEKSSVAVLVTSLITGKLLPSALVWVTTRPAAVNKNLCDLFDLVTEVQGFNEVHREEYFRKVIPEKAEQVITHIKSKRSLYIMCHIPVFCRITAAVLGEMEEQSASGQEMPKTLTEMYTHFSVFQMNIMSERCEKKMSAMEKAQLLIKLGKLAFKHLQKGTQIFYERDLSECQIDVNSGVLHAGLCTQIFKKESAISGESMFSFVHLSVQEFLAALYLLHTHATDQVNLLIDTILEKISWKLKNTRFDLYKMTVTKALKSQNGHLDLCVRFLLGLAPILKPTEKSPLNVLLPHLYVTQVSIEKMVEYVKKMISKNITPERIINLFHCLNELGDNSLVDEINRYMSSAEEKDLTPAQCSALAYLLLMSAEDFEEFDLKKYQRSEEGLHRMLPIIIVSRRVWLDRCHLSKASCEMMASVLRVTDSQLRELDMSDNDLQDKGVELLCVGLRNPQSKLERLRLKGCQLSKTSCGLLASVLRGIPSHLRELDMDDNELHDNGVQLLCEGLKDSHCKLETLRMNYCFITQKGCSFLASALKSNPSYLKELDLSYNHPGDTGVLELTDRLNDPSCKLETFRYDHGGEFRLKSGVRRYACELTLDPNTAHRHLSLSEGNRKVTWVNKEQPYPDHPERFYSCQQVLCGEALSGRCYWEVEWNADRGGIGVAYKSIQRRGDWIHDELGYNDKSWCLWYYGNRFMARHNCLAEHNNKESLVFAPFSRNRRVGVYLDWPAGTLSFYSVSSDTLSISHLYTFHCEFTEPLYPGIFAGYSNMSSSLCKIT